MASIILRNNSKIVTKCPNNIKWGISSITTTMKKQKEPQIINDIVLLKPEEIERRRKLQDCITVDADTNISPITGIPEEHIKPRTVRIYQPPKNAMQSGTNNIGHWEIDFDNRERWENPLMGWCSTGDPHSNLKVSFSNPEEAIEYCNKNGWKWWIQKSSLNKTFKPKSYGVNFSWNKRTRVSTK